MKKTAILLLIMVSFGFTATLCAAETAQSDAKDAKKESKTETPKKAEQEPGLDVVVRLGPEFSSFNKGDDTATADTKNALGNQYFFTEIAARFPVIENWFYVTPQVRFGKINVKSDEKISTNPDMTKVIKDASAVGGKAEVTAYFMSSKLLYFRAAPEFFYVYNTVNTKDVAFDSFFGFGIQANNPQNAYRDSYFEFGYGYSERLPKSNRFKLNLQLIRDLGSADKTNLRPFIKTSIDTDLGRGADDIRIMYGVELPAENIWKSAFGFISGVMGGKNNSATVEEGKK